MGFRQGAYGKIWSIDRKEKYSIGNFTVSRKKQDGSGYDTEFQDGYVRFVGSAHEALKGLEIPKNGLSIKISSCDVTNKYDPESKRVYTNYAIFGLEVQDNNGNNSRSSTPTPPKDTEPSGSADIDDNELPF